MLRRRWPARTFCIYVTFCGAENQMCFYTCMCVFIVKGSLQKRNSVGILSQPAWPPPPSLNVGIPKKEKKEFMFTLHFRLFQAYYLFMKITFFGWLVFFLVWTWDPHHIATKSLFCMVVVFGFKKLRLGQTPAPLVGTKSQLLLIFLKASLNIIDSSYKSISSVDGCHLFHSRVGLQNQEEARTESQLCLRVKCIGGNMSKLIWSMWSWCI